MLPVLQLGTLIVTILFYVSVPPCSSTFILAFSVSGVFVYSCKAHRLFVAFFLQLTMLYLLAVVFFVGIKPIGALDNGVMLCTLRGEINFTHLYGVTYLQMIVCLFCPSEATV